MGRTIDQRWRFHFGPVAHSRSWPSSISFRPWSICCAVNEFGLGPEFSRPDLALSDTRTNSAGWCSPNHRDIRARTWHAEFWLTGQTGVQANIRVTPQKAQGHQFCLPDTRF